MSPDWDFPFEHDKTLWKPYIRLLMGILSMILRKSDQFSIVNGKIFRFGGCWKLCEFYLEFLLLYWGQLTHTYFFSSKSFLSWRLHWPGSHLVVGTPGGSPSLSQLIAHGIPIFVETYAFEMTLRSNYEFTRRRQRGRCIRPFHWTLTTSLLMLRPRVAVRARFIIFID